MTSIPFLPDRPQIVHQVLIKVVAGVIPTASVSVLFNDSSERGPVVSAWMRQVAIYVLLRRFDIGLNPVSRFFRRNSATVLHSATLVEEHCGKNELTAAFVTFIEMQTRTILADLEAVETETGSLPAEYALAGGFFG